MLSIVLSSFADSYCRERRRKIVMAQRVAGDLYVDIDGQMWEIKRQLRQKSGYPYNPMKLVEHLQAAIEGNFVNHNGKPFLKEVAIDRTRPFDPVQFFGQGWIQGWTIEEEDENSLSLNQVDLANVQLKHMLNPDEIHISGEQRLERLKKAGHIRLDAKVLQTLWENQGLIPEVWKQKTDGGTIRIFFDGTILLDPNGVRSSLFLDLMIEDQWRWYVYGLNLDRYICHPSAVLASI
jgi:hypothetical protein